MNYIIWKDVNSQNLEGLIICELPPISKPQMKVETTVIDGKDGDITDDLGYQSYEKTLKIGLTKNYDIDEIIQYFSGKGEIIFSNEPDKFYQAEITDQIDNVKFHVQPFKYLVDEQPIELEIDEETELEITNQGNKESKPIITLYGEGVVTISVNNHAIFEIDIDDEYVIVDNQNEEAYKGNVLKNRFMIGRFPIFETGENIITWAGSLTKIEVQPKSRWL